MRQMVMAAAVLTIGACASVPLDANYTAGKTEANIPLRAENFKFPDMSSNYRRLRVSFKTARSLGDNVDRNGNIKWGCELDSIYELNVDESTWSETSRISQIGRCPKSYIENVDLEKGHPNSPLLFEKAVDKQVAVSTENGSVEVIFKPTSLHMCAFVMKAGESCQLSRGFLPELHTASMVIDTDQRYVKSIAFFRNEDVGISGIARSYESSARYEYSIDDGGNVYLSKRYFRDAGNSFAVIGLNWMQEVQFRPFD